MPPPSFARRRWRFLEGGRAQKGCPGVWRAFSTRLRNVFDIFATSLHIRSLPFAPHKRFKGRIADQAIRLQEIRQTTERPSTVHTEKAPYLNSQGLARTIRGVSSIIPMRLEPMVSMTSWTLRWRA